MRVTLNCCLRPHERSKTNNLTVLAGIGLLLGLTVYGGFWRESCASGEPKDLDMLVWVRADVFRDFAQHLAALLRNRAIELGFESDGDLEMHPPPKPDHPPVSASIRFRYGETILHVDLSSVDVLDGIDFDVNAMWMHGPTRRLELRGDVGLTLEELIAKCKEKKFCAVLPGSNRSSWS